MDGDLVSVNYTGTLDSGEEFDSSWDRGPLSFVIGAGQMISGFDAAVNGMKVGESKTVRLEPEDAYGMPNDDFIIDFSIDQLPEGLSVGGSVRFQDGAQGIILEINSETFKVDANHKFAGQALTFEIELVSIN
jgi:FKBP-type peptidyl-prolyl cis-trans isomerase 2